MCAKLSFLRRCATQVMHFTINKSIQMTPARDPKQQKNLFLGLRVHLGDIWGRHLGQTSMVRGLISGEGSHGERPLGETSLLRTPSW